MTSTVNPSPMQPPLTSPMTFVRRGELTLVDQIVAGIRQRVDDRLWRAGTRMPSIRDFAETYSLSRHTVVAAYDRLVALGLIESRRGAGFFVRAAQSDTTKVRRRTPVHSEQTSLDTSWLIHSVLREMPASQVPGGGLMPKEWMDGSIVSNSLRHLGRLNPHQFLMYGNARGFLPLRQQLQLRLADLDIAADPDQIHMTNGVTQAIDLIARVLTRPGDTVLVDDPSWFMAFAMFAAQGLRVIGVPRLGDGPDLVRLAELVREHQPRLYMTVSVLHNPTSHSLSAAKAFQVLKLAEEHDFYIVEDDIYCDLHDPAGSHSHVATRIAGLDQLNRVFYMGGFSKTLAPSLRLGFIAAPVQWSQQLMTTKLLASLTTSEIVERIVYQSLSEGLYRKHTERLRQKLDQIRGPVIRQCERIGLTVENEPSGGMFLWINAHCDSGLLTQRALEKDILLAPGSLFSPVQLPTTYMRINVSAMTSTTIWPLLESLLAKI